eukprot:gene11448-34158_t
MGSDSWATNYADETHMWFFFASHSLLLRPQDPLPDAFLRSVINFSPFVQRSRSTCYSTRACAKKDDNSEVSKVHDISVTKVMQQGSWKGCDKGNTSKEHDCGRSDRREVAKVHENGVRSAGKWCDKSEVIKVHESGVTRVRRVGVVPSGVCPRAGAWCARVLSPRVVGPSAREWLWPAWCALRAAEWFTPWPRVRVPVPSGRRRVAPAAPTALGRPSGPARRVMSHPASQCPAVVEARGCKNKREAG